MPDQDFTIRIDLPTVITVRVWDTYQDGRMSYLRKATVGSVIMADYHGSLALIKAQLVTVEAPPEFQQYLQAEKADDIPLAFIGLIVREIAAKVEAAASGPLPIKVISSRAS